MKELQEFLGKQFSASFNDIYYYMPATPGYASTIIPMLVFLLFATIEQAFAECREQLVIFLAKTTVR